MLDSPIFELALAMIFIYILLSILVTQMNSLVATFLKIRAEHFRRGIYTMIQDPIIRAKVFTHPLVRMIKDEMVLPDQRITDEEAERISSGKLEGVHWVAPKTFVNVLMDVIRVDSDKELFGSMLNIVDGMPAGPDRRRLRLAVNRIMTKGEGLDELRDTIAALKEPIYREALTEALDQIDDEFGRLGLEADSVISLIAGVRNIKNPYFRTVLETVLSTARTLDEAEQQLTTWFDEGMDRVSQRFARSMQMITLLIGFLLALLVNIDSINIAFTLWNDPAARGAIAELAQNQDVLADLEERFETAQAQLPTPEPETDPSAPSPEATPEPSTIPEQDVGEILDEAAENIYAAQITVNQLMSLRIPLGWNFINLSHISHDTENPVELQMLNDSTNLWNFFPGNSPNWFGLILGKIIGLAATVIAIGQGAPFWFSLLRRLTGGSSKNEAG